MEDNDGEEGGGGDIGDTDPLAAMACGHLVGFSFFAEKGPQLLGNGASQYVCVYTVHNSVHIHQYIHVYVHVCISSFESHMYNHLEDIFQTCNCGVGTRVLFLCLRMILLLKSFQNEYSSKSSKIFKVDR